MLSGPEGGLAARAVAALLITGGLMGSVNLLVDGVLREGAGRWAYDAMMLLLLTLGASIAARGRITPRHTFALVLVGDLVYLVVVLCIDDPLRYATPLMLLFPALIAAWFLNLRRLCVHMLVTVAVCLAALRQRRRAGRAGGGQRGDAQRRRARGLPAAAADPAAAGRHRDADPPRPADRPVQPQAPGGAGAPVWRQARRDGTRVSAMVLDLDHFKRLNDQFGHAAGDQVLTTVGRALAATVRPVDVLARTGGEELVVLGPVSDAAEARRLAERLRAAVAAARTPDGYGVTASIGLALTRPVDDEDPVAALWRLVDRGDAAMYEAKRRGRDRVATAAVPRARSAHPEETPA